MKKEIKIYEQGLEKFPKANIILGNSLILIWIGLGTIACWFFSPIAGYLYIAFAITMVYIILRKLVCTNCYYYSKWCSLGWGKLSALFFKKGDIQKFSSCPGIKMAGPTYGLLCFIPLALIIISLFQNFTITKIIVLVLLFIVCLFSAVINRRKTCSKCKMRLVCPGCAVKTKDQKG